MAPSHTERTSAREGSGRLGWPSGPVPVPPSKSYLCAVYLAGEVNRRDLDFQRWVRDNRC